MDVLHVGQMFFLVSPKALFLGPTLFLIFINDIDLAFDVTGSFLLKFADDTKLGMVVESEEQRDLLQTGIANLEHWSLEWQRMFNASHASPGGQDCCVFPVISWDAR